MHFQRNDNLSQRGQKQLENKLPFVLYRRPNEDLVNGIFQFNPVLYQLYGYEQKGFVFAPFSGAPPVVITADELLSGSLTRQPTNESDVQLDLNKGKSVHLALVKKAISKISEGELEKVVVSRCIKVLYDKSAIQLFSNLAVKYSNAFCYLFFHPKIGLWIGATPEQFLKIEGNQLFTTALAGTLPYEQDKEPNWTQKEFTEQAMVTKHIVENLNKLDLDPKTEGPNNKRAGKLWHLNTKVFAQLSKKNSIKAIINALHPTPAVCGLPTQKAKAFILNNENYDREYYTGFLGELNLLEDDINLFVNLRCMQLQDTTAVIYVGGGITKDSEPEKEWQETINKSKTILDLL